MTAAAISSVEVGKPIPVVASPAKKKFHELNPNMLSSELIMDRHMAPIFMTIYVAVNIIFVCIPFLFDLALSCQLSVVKKAEKELEISYEKLNNLIWLESKNGTYSTSTPSESIINARDACDTASQNLIKAQALLEEGKPAPAPARAQVKKAERELKKKIREIEKELKTLDNFILDVEVDFLHEADYKKRYDLGASLDRIKGERVKIKERLNHAKDNLAEFKGLRAAPTPAPMSDEDSYLPPDTCLEGMDF